jgi:hypothetical protein
MQGRCAATLGEALPRLAEGTCRWRRVAFVGAPTPLHFSITRHLAELADVLACEKPAVLTHEFTGWRNSQAAMTRQEPLLRTHRTKVASPVVAAAPLRPAGQPHRLLESALYRRLFPRQQGAHFCDRRSAVRHTPFEDKRVHDEAALMRLVRPEALQVRPCPRLGW